MSNKARAIVLAISVAALVALPAAAAWALSQPYPKRYR